VLDAIEFHHRGRAADAHAVATPVRADRDGNADSSQYGHRTVDRPQGQADAEGQPAPEHDTHGRAGTTVDIRTRRPDIR
jgi:hypothetical protein